MIREIRTLLNISQEDLARELHISFATVNRWENAKAMPSKMAQRALIDYCKQNKVLTPVLDKYRL
jgi:DNA-binding transcriptional regulator YiaG